MKRKRMKSHLTPLLYIRITCGHIYFNSHYKVLGLIGIGVFRTYSSEDDLELESFASLSSLRGTESCYSCVRRKWNLHLTAEPRVACYSGAVDVTQKTTGKQQEERDVLPSSYSLYAHSPSAFWQSNHKVQWQKEKESFTSSLPNITQ